MSGATVTSTQRGVSFSGRFDTTRFEAEKARRSVAGPNQGRYVDLYRPVSDFKHHSIAQFDFVFQTKSTSLCLAEERYDAHDTGKAILNVMPRISSNLLGLLMDDEEFAFYLYEGVPLAFAKQRAVLDSIIVRGVAKYACEFRGVPDEKDIAFLTQGTIDVLAYEEIRAGQSLVYAAPLESEVKKTNSGQRDKEGLDQARLYAQPIDNACRLTLEALVDWVNGIDKDKLDTPAVPITNPITAREVKVAALKTYIKNGGNRLWTIPGQFLYELYLAEAQVDISKWTPSVGQSLKVLTNWLHKILVGVDYRRKPSKLIWNTYARIVNIELYASNKSLLEALKRYIGKATGSAEKGKYAAVVLDM